MLTTSAWVENMAEVVYTNVVNLNSVDVEILFEMIFQ